MIGGAASAEVGMPGGPRRGTLSGVKIYADRFPTALRQLLTDLLVVAWVYAAIRGALWLHDLVQKLAVPGQKMEGAGGGLADNLADAGGKVGRVPLVGDELTAPFERAAEAARSLAEAGRDQQELVDQLALALAVGMLIVPLSLVLFGWLPLRVRWMRRAGSAAALAAAPAGRDLLALRALAGQPLGKLTRIAPDVAEAWRRGDDATVDALAALELRRLGLRDPRR
ncbi:hypothetical protein SAMN05443287_109177 [Micromonospora phaseoli]|uniref:Uncharacterized protein n=1 Tax=Micromonospora phaseoli TaxID=1144548 RepID=A0A1H7CNF8_9ACTN|nr:hypothetical protein CLV64_10577 [Micromonospora phaseoli]GIJ78450.1 hypothetical protein Xph01_28820 [Micromonospora phaseoli]SEJ88672.1 hypothetical protein SAMN05443287_109177 [Micromonospora phaseoli]